MNTKHKSNKCGPSTKDLSTIFGNQSLIDTMGDSQACPINSIDNKLQIFKLKIYFLLCIHTADITTSVRTTTIDGHRNRRQIHNDRHDGDVIVDSVGSVDTIDPFVMGGGQPLLDEPYFDESTPKNVTALAGKSAYLTCRVRNIGNKTVSLLYFFILEIFSTKLFFPPLALALYSAIFQLWLN